MRVTNLTDRIFLIYLFIKSLYILKILKTLREERFLPISVIKYDKTHHVDNRMTSVVLLYLRRIFIFLKTNDFQQCIRAYRMWSWFRSRTCPLQGSHVLCCVGWCVMSVRVSPYITVVVCSVFRPDNPVKI